MTRDRELIPRLSSMPLTFSQSISIRFTCCFAGDVAAVIKNLIRWHENGIREARSVYVVLFVRVKLQRAPRLFKLRCEGIPLVAHFVKLNSALFQQNVSVIQCLPKLSHFCDE